VIRKAVLLAGGFGSRICSVLGCVSKQVIRIRGLELIMYPIISLYDAGIDIFHVVGNPTNYHILDEILKRYCSIIGFDYTIDFNPYPDSSNGNTALIGLKKFREPVILSVTDHIYPSELPQMLIRANDNESDILVAGDRNPVVVDVGEATKIIADEHDRIIRVSKDLDRYDYIDSGVFRVNKPAKITGLFDPSRPVGLSELISDKNIVARVHGFNGIVWKDIDVINDLLYVSSNRSLQQLINRLINTTLEHVHGKV
jgi:choline kinase